ncbi:MAG: hypothetical protein KGM18_01065 [Sphingomonadales bacterium]|nr:hypothetical protein [Sphingomonadales bacterium]
MKHRLNVRLFVATAIAALSGAAVSGAALAEGDTAPVAPPPVAHVRVDAAVSRGMFVHPERYNNFANPRAFAQQREADVAFLNQQGLHGKIYKVWIAAKSLHDAGTGAYDYAPVDAYLAQASRVSDALLMVMDTRIEIRDEKQTPAQIKPVIKRIMLDLKRKYPAIRYVEAFNEPDYNLAKVLSPEQLYDFYRVYYEAVNEVNRELKPKVPLEIGGPAFMMFNEPWLKAFLDRYKADPSPAKRLDFISWHGYGYFEQGGGAPGALKPYHFFKGNPSEVGGQRAMLDAELRSRGLDTRIPAFITETGIYPGPSNDNPRDPRPDYLIGAAGVMSLHYWFIEQPRTYPFNWVVRHTTEERKDQLVSRPGNGQPPLTGVFTPYGNAMAMMARLQDERVAAVSDKLVDGKGVYAIATRGRGGMAVMLWNYQHTGSQTYHVQLDLAHLPPSLRGRPVQETHYRIDGSVSNYWADPARANLQQTATRTVTPKSSHEVALDLSPNALELVLIEPAGKHGARRR